jgi:hypothetical protein
MLDLAPFAVGEPPYKPDWAGNIPSLAPFEGVEGGGGIINFPRPCISVLVLHIFLHPPPLPSKGGVGGMDQRRRENCSTSTGP